jgi:hypothetical protein
LFAFYGPFCYVEVDLTIDETYLGTTAYTYPIVAGEHTLEVPPAIYADGNWYYFNSFCIMTDFGMALQTGKTTPQS